MHVFLILMRFIFIHNIMRSAVVNSYINNISFTIIYVFRNKHIVYYYNDANI